MTAPIQEVTITHFNSRGKGVASLPRGEHPPLKVEVLGGIPQDKLQVLLGKKRRGTCLASIDKILTPSPMRVEPLCKHVPLCGGCTWQQMGYNYQLQEKESLIKKIFSNLLEGVQLHPIIACENPWEYRNKMEFTFSQDKKGESFLGLILAGSKGHVFNLEECSISSSWFAKTLQAVRQWWENSHLAAYRLNNEGTLRYLTLREGKRTSDKLVMLTVSGNPDFAPKESHLHSFVETIKNSLPGCNVSIFLRIQQIAKGSPTQFFEMLLDGPDHIKEILHINTGSEKKDLTFKISPTSFFQPNTAQAEILYSRALQMASPGNQVLDLYCGTGTLSMAFALTAKQVTGIELNPHAVFDAKSNLEENKFTNVNIIQGDVGKTLLELKKDPGFSCDLAVVDPPRSGLDGPAISHLLSLSPKEILYVSCNPKTQAENISQLADYQLLELQPVDQFPHTLHIENIALLKRRV